MFRGNAARTGEMPGPGPDPTHGVQERWRFETGTQDSSSAAVVDGVVYVGDIAGDVHALDAATGTKQWGFATGEAVMMSPTVVGGVVYVVNYIGIVYALDVVTGTERWRFATSAYSPASPAVVDGKVFVGVTKSLTGDDGTTVVEGTLFALDAATGTERWQFTTDDDLGDPAVADGLVYVSSDHGNLYAVDAATGTERWRVSIDGNRSHYGPTVADGVVYVGDDDTLYALDGTNGAEQWQFTVGGDRLSSPAVVDGAIYLSGSPDGIVYALEAAQPVLQNGTTAEVADGGTALRGGPSESAVVRAELDAGTVVTITGEAEPVAQGETWWPVTVNDTGEVGWVKGEDLVAVFLDE